jgi:hypothetical protein
MRVLIVSAFFCCSLPALAGGHEAFGWGAGAFNSSYRPAGSTPAHTPDWRALTPSWRGGFVTYPSARHFGPAYGAPYSYYYPAYAPSYYPPYGSTYYGFQPTEPEPAPEPQLQTPPQVIVFEHREPSAPAPEPSPAPQVIVVQVPVPVPAPAPAAPAPLPAPEPQKPAGPAHDVFHWVDADGVHHYSTQVPAGVKAEKVGPK